MGLRVESDVEWYMFGNEKMRLSEDGFCSNCKDHYTDCFCIAFWVRKCANLSKSARDNYSLNQERLKFTEDFEIARCEHCQNVRKNSSLRYCKYHQLKLERMKLI